MHISRAYVPIPLATPLPDRNHPEQSKDGLQHVYRAKIDSFELSRYIPHCNRGLEAQNKLTLHINVGRKLTQYMTTHELLWYFSYDCRGLCATWSHLQTVWMRCGTTQPRRSFASHALFIETHLSSIVGSQQIVLLWLRLVQQNVRSCVSPTQRKELSRSQFPRGKSLRDSHSQVKTLA